MTRTLEGVKWTRAQAERENWHDYGKQAQADVDFLLEMVDKLTTTLRDTNRLEAAPRVLRNCVERSYLPVKQGDVFVCGNTECHRTVEAGAGRCPSGHLLTWVWT